MKPEDFDLFISDDEVKMQIVKNASEIDSDKDSVNQILTSDYVKIIIDLKNDENNAVAWGCDLTYNYVKENGYFL